MPRLLSRLVFPTTMLILLGFNSFVFAAIKKPLPLKDVLEQEQIIVVAEVEKTVPDKPSATFKIIENLKAKSPVEKLAINMTGDSEAQKLKQVPMMFDRLAPGRKLVLFISKNEESYSCFAFTEGTWLQLQGTKDGEQIRWAFLHGEPYLRRTFAGTTAELTETVKECLAGKRQPPACNDKEPPGYGPIAKPKCDTPEACLHSSLATPHYPLSTLPPLFAVIPSFVLLGPLALVAAFFPAVFARLAMAMTRWRAFLVVASTNTTLAMIYYWMRDFDLLPDSRWVGPQAFSVLLMVCTLIGLLWATQRYCRMAIEDPAVTAPPHRREVLVLLSVTTVSVLIVAAMGYFAGWAAIVELPWREFTAVGVGIVGATGYAVYRAVKERRTTSDSPLSVQLSLSGETVGIAAILLFSISVLVLTGPRTTGQITPLGSAEFGDAVTEFVDGPKLVESKILFETADMHEILSSLTISTNRIYFGTSKTTGFRQNGAVYCVDRDTGTERWKFTDGGQLKPVFATPALANGKIFAGEGLHTDAFRRLFCLDSDTGKPAWPQPVTTSSHTEGSPRVVNGKVYFTAGDDGLYCVNATDGEEIWHIKGGDETKLHIDTPPAVGNGKVYVGSGYRSLNLLCLNAETGAEIWRTPAPLRSFGPPLVVGQHVYFGLGTGNLTEDLAHEADEGLPQETRAAGAVLCLDANTGQTAWKFDLDKSVHTAVVADSHTLFAACKDGSLYAIDRKSGKLRWKRPCGSTFTSGPAIATYAGGSLTLAVYAVSQEGTVVCLHPHDGTLLWTRDLRAQTGRDVQVFSTPVLVNLDEGGSKRHLFISAMATNPNNKTKSAVLFRIEDSSGE